LNIADGKCDFSTGTAPAPTLIISTPADVWLKIARQELNGAFALLTGKYKARGQMSLLLKMDSLFSRKPTEAELAAMG
jgi:putative sterol carrier protein